MTVWLPRRLSVAVQRWQLMRWRRHHGRTRHDGGFDYRLVPGVWTRSRA